MMLCILGCAARPPAGDPLRASAEALGWSREAGMSDDGEEWTWCKAPDPIIGCSVLRLTPGAAWRRWSAHRWEAAEVPADGWGAQLRVEGEDWRLELRRHVQGTQTEELSLGRTMTMDIEITEVTADGGAFDGFTADGTIGAAVCSRVTRLVAAGIAELDAGRVQRCHYGSYLGDSAVECRPVPLPAREIELWKKQLADKRDRHCAQMATDGPALAALLRRLWPR
jgi:hypothetical protein